MGTTKKDLVEDLKIPNGLSIKAKELAIEMGAEAVVIIAPSLHSLIRTDRRPR